MNFYVVCFFIFVVFYQPPIQNICLDPFSETYPCAYNERCVWSQSNSNSAGNAICKPCGQNSNGEALWGSKCQFLDYCSGTVQTNQQVFPYSYEYQWEDDGLCDYYCQNYGNTKTNTDTTIQLYIEKFGTSNQAMQICADQLLTVHFDLLVGNWFVGQPNYDQINYPNRNS